MLRVDRLVTCLLCDCISHEIVGIKIQYSFTVEFVQNSKLSSPTIFDANKQKGKNNLKQSQL
jgi:hypothetical protein